jgi:putative transposase
MLDAIQYRYGYLKRVLDAGRWCGSADNLKALISLHAEQIGDKEPPSDRTVRRWYRRYHSNGRALISLLPLHHKKGGDSSSYTAQENETYKRYLETHFLTREQLTLKKAYSLMCAELEQHNREHHDKALRIPTIGKFYTLKNQIPAYDQILARKGRQAANIEFRHGRRGPEAIRVLERVEVDHTRMDLVVRCDETGLSLGTPTLTVLLDVASREVLGFYLSFSGPGVNSILNALTHAITPKTYVRERYPSVQLDWPCYGVPNVLVLDNEPSHHSPEFQRACTQLGITLHYCPAKNPTQKGKIERFFRTLNTSLLHCQPGTTRSNREAVGDYDSDKEATISFSCLVEMLHVWVIDVYGNSVHRGLDSTPHAAWNRLAKQDPPRLIDDVSLLNQKILNVRNAVLQRYGIDINSLRYQSVELMALYRHIGKGRSIEVRYDEENLGSIFVTIPGSSEMFEVPCDNPEYANGMTLVLHRAIRKHIRDKGENSADKQVVRNALLRLRDLERESATATKKAQRRMRAKQRGISSRAKSAPVNAPVSDRNVCPAAGFFNGTATELSPV